MKPWIALGLVMILGWSPALSFGETAMAAARFFQTREGMRVYLVENHANPMVEVSILTRGGSVFDPIGKEGVAYLTAWMFNEGAGEMDSETFRGRLDYYGIVMDANAGRDTLGVNMTTLSGHLEEAFGLLSLAVTQPRFDREDLERARQETISTLKQSREHADWLAGLRLYAMMFPGHGYGHPTIGSEESVARITLNDVRQFHVKSMHGPQMVMAVAGDVTEATLRQLLEKTMGGVDPRPSLRGPIAATPSVAEGALFHVAMDSPQTAIEMGVVAMDREDGDYYPMLVLGQAFGGHGLTSRLFEEIREKRGLAYGVNASFSPLEGRGPFVISMKTKTDTVAEALGLIREEMTVVARDGLGKQELEDVKRYLTQSFALNFDTLKKQAATWSLIGYYRRGMDYLQRWPERILGVGEGDVKRVARRILNPNHFQTVTVGKTVR
ncbi:MAG: insulinase family protein [Nitrospirae bacterium]|nr:insulinase family protein [Magnetococcales bacterium]HAT51597.1 hypothetical protein [Alphaproteobacteria bacterium]